MDRREWTGKEVVFLKENYQKMGSPWCAAQLGRSIGSVRKQAQTVGANRPAFTVGGLPNEFEVRAIKRAYASLEKGAIKQCAQSLGRTVGWVQYRAREMGLYRRPRPFTPWSEAEIAFAQAHAHLKRETISQKMRKRGWKRTGDAVSNQLKAIGHTPSDNEMVSALIIAECLGVCVTTITKWIKQGYLSAQIKDRNYREGQPAFYCIKPEDVAIMAVRHPTLIELRKVDAVWFIDLIARHGTIGLLSVRDKSERIIALKAENPNRTNAEIATIVGSTKDSVAVQISKARKEGLLPPVDPTSIQSLRAA